MHGNRSLLNNSCSPDNFIGLKEFFEFDVRQLEVRVLRPRPSARTLRIGRTIRRALRKRAAVAHSGHAATQATTVGMVKRYSDAQPRYTVQWRGAGREETTRGLRASALFVATPVACLLPTRTNDGSCSVPV